jgi:hypothetical protein
MSVQAFKFYKTYKQYISGTVNNGSTSFDLHLVKSTSNFATNTLSTYGSITNEIASAGGYTLAGKAMTKTWSTGASAGQAELNFTAISHSASANMTSILAFVLVARTGASAKASGNKLIGYASLTSAVFSVSSGNKLIINPSASGLFTLT